MINVSAIAQQIKKGEPIKSTTVRTLLKSFDAARRGSKIVTAIQEQLEAVGLSTVPDLTEASIDAPIQFVLIQERKQPSMAARRSQAPASDSNLADIRALIRDVLKAELAPKAESTEILSLAVTDGVMARWKALQAELTPKTDNDILTSMMDLFTVRASLVTRTPVAENVRRHS